MKRRVLLILFVICAFLSACNNKKTISALTETISVYRVITPEHQKSGELLSSEKLAVKGENQVSQAISALTEEPKSDKLQRPLPEDVKILDSEHLDNSVIVKMSPSYLDLSAIDRVIFNSCLTLTLCSIENVDYVTIFVGSEIVEDRLTSEDILLFNSVISSRKAQVRLYFPRTEGLSLSAEYHSISIDEDNSAERRILDALLDGPQSEKLKKAFPSETVVLSVYTQDNISTVSLSGIIPDDITKSREEGILAVYSIVNSLTTLSNIQSVQILIDGKQVQELWGVDISRPLTRNDSIIGSAITE